MNVSEFWIHWSITTSISCRRWWRHLSSHWNSQICVDFRASIFSLFQIYSINFFVRRYVIQWNKNYNTSHFFVNEISVFQHKFHQQFFRQTSRRSRRHHELFVENKMLQKLHTYMHHNTPILIHFQQDWCFSIFKPNFFLARKQKSATQKRVFKEYNERMKKRTKKVFVEWSRISLFSPCGAIIHEKVSLE